MYPLGTGFIRWMEIQQEVLPLHANGIRTHKIYFQCLSCPGIRCLIVVKLHIA